MGVESRETSHSDILSWLLIDPENRAFRRNFVLCISNHLGDERDIVEDEPIKVWREFYDCYANNQIRIDLVAQLQRLKFAVAIEVKVKAPEGNNQISKYQTVLARRFPNYKKIVVFLTPKGEPPSTACERDDVRVLSMSWSNIADIINVCPGSGNEHDFRVQISKHIYRNLMNDKEERRIIIDLLKEGDNKNTVRKIVDNYPHLGDEEYLNAYKCIVAELLFTDKSNLVLETYTYRGIVRELKIKVVFWTAAGLPFVLMLYNYENSAIRVLIHNNDYQENQEDLIEFSQQSGDVIGDYQQLTHWTCWRSVFASEGNNAEVDETLINAEIYESEFWVQVKQNLKTQLNLLLPLIGSH